MSYFARIAILTGACMLPVLLLFGFVLYRRIKQTKESNKIDRVIDDALNNRYRDKSKRSLSEKVINFWSRLLKPAGLVDPISNDKRNVSILLIISLLIFIITFLFTFNPLLALIPPIVANVVLIVYCKIKVNELNAMVNEQVPSFLSSLKSNIQSNETPERALLSAINTTADPLYKELRVVKSLIETGSFETALSALRQRTENEYLRFLCSCIELSTIVGSNLEEQITSIEKMITDRQELTRKTDTAVAQNTPILYVLAVAVPGLFVFMYLNDESVRAYWFHSLISWVLFFSIFIICGVGVYIGNRIIQSVRKM